MLIPVRETRAQLVEFERFQLRHELTLRELCRRHLVDRSTLTRRFLQAPRPRPHCQLLLGLDRSLVDVLRTQRELTRSLEQLWIY